MGNDPRDKIQPGIHKLADLDLDPVQSAAEIQEIAEQRMDWMLGKGFFRDSSGKIKWVTSGRVMGDVGAVMRDLPMASFYVETNRLEDCKRFLKAVGIKKYIYGQSAEPGKTGFSIGGSGVQKIQELRERKGIQSNDELAEIADEVAKVRKRD